MFRFLKDMPLSAKIAALGAGSTLVAALALVGLATWQSGEYNALAQGEVDELISADLDNIARGVYSLVQTEDRSVQQQVDYNLNVARHILAEARGLELAPAQVDWTARNQFTGVSTEIRLPQMLVGGQWLGQTADPTVESRVVDDVTGMVGGTTTIFQRMNPEGDMLRVATTVQTSTGQRAIGTYIPATGPEGAANPVIAAILSGKTYHGRAYVVDAWYLTAYEAITNGAGETIGMLYVGVKQSSVESRVREAILQTSVGKTGYLYVLGSQGERRGHYIISQRGERDGEDIWESRDSDGNYVIQAIIAKATALAPGELATERYRWQNPGEPAPRWKVARLAYYAPWDWVIGTSVYEDELQTYRAILGTGRARMTGVMGVAGLLITLLIGFVGVLAARSIARPVREMTRVAETITGGDLTQVVEVHSHDEIGSLASAFNFMTRELRRTLRNLQNVHQELEQRVQELHASEQKYRQIVETSQEGIVAIDEDTRVSFVNQQMTALTGYSADELLGHAVSEFTIPEESADHAGQMLQRRAGEAGCYERRFRHRDGHMIVMQVSATPLFDNTGRFRGAFAMLTDITDRYRAEEELRRSRNMLAHVLNSIPQAVFWKDRAGVYLGCNDVFARAVGLESGADIVGKTDFDLPWPRASAEAYRADDREVIERGISKRHIVEPLQQADGTRVWIDATKVPLLDAEGRCEGVLGVYEDVTERKQTEETLIRIYKAVECSSDAIGMADAQGRHFYQNKAFTDLFEYEPEEVTGTEDSPVIFANALVAHEVLTAVKSGGSWSGEIEVQSKRGRRFPVRLRADAIKDEQGNVIGLVGVHTDITERRQAEEERARLTAILETTSDLVGMATPDGRISYVNAAGRRLLGWEATEDIAGRTVASIHPAPAFALIWDEGVPTAIAQGEWQGETALLTADGREIPTSQVILAHRDAAGAVEYVSTIIRDITERKRTEEALRRSAERHQTVLRTAMDGFLMIDTEGHVLEVNKTYCEMSGYSEHELLSMSINDLEAIESPAEVAAHGLRVQAQGRDRFESRHRRKDGGFVDVEVSIQLIPSQDKQLAVFVRDITELKRAEAERDRLETQLRQAQKMEAIGQLAGGVAHDFNNILTAIFGNVELALAELESQFPAARDVIEGMRQVEKSAERASQLTRQLLAFSRRQVVRPAVLDVNATLRDLEKMLHRLITENITLSLHCAPDLRTVRVDPGQLEQVIVNLVVNARDAMPDGGRLTLETQNVVFEEKYIATHSELQAGAYVLLAVSDTGSGMDRGTLERVFEPFFTTKPAGRGTGLGLSTVYGIVQQAGGNVVVYSEPGHGTTFRVYLPISQEAAAPAVRELDAGPLPTGVETLLICEDDAAVRELTAFILKEAGYTVLVAAHPQEALQLAAAAGPLHLLITDVIMPDMNGRKLADALMQVRPDLRMLFVSGYASNVIVHHGVLEKDVEFLEKPYSRRRLLQRVREVLEAPLPRLKET